MTAGWPCAALRAPLTDGTPEPGTDASAKPLENNRSVIRSLDPSRNSLQKPSQKYVAVIRSIKPSRKCSRTKFFDVASPSSEGRLTCVDVNGSRRSGKGVPARSERRYRLTYPHASRHTQGAIR